MSDEESFPWELLKAECLRLVCQQLCHSQSGLTNALGKRDEMIVFLRDVNTRGLEAAVSAVEQAKLSQRANREGRSGTKRKNTEDESADDDADNDEPETPQTPTGTAQVYNTRFKGVKRVKIGREVPEGFPYTTPQRRRPRKSAPAALGSSSRKNENDSPKRRRGRPPKSSLGPRPSNRPPASSGKKIFDGVVMLQRSKRPVSRTTAPHSDARLQELLKMSPGGHHDPDADAEGEMDAEVEEAVALVQATTLTVDVVSVNGVVDSQDGIGASDANQADVGTNGGEQAVVSANGGDQDGVGGINDLNGPSQAANEIDSASVTSVPLSLSAILTGHLDLS